MFLAKNQKQKQVILVFANTYLTTLWCGNSFYMYYMYVIFFKLNNSGHFLPGEALYRIASLCKLVRKFGLFWDINCMGCGEGKGARHSPKFQKGKFSYLKTPSLVNWLEAFEHLTCPHKSESWLYSVPQTNCPGHLILYAPGHISLRWFQSVVYSSILGCCILGCSIRDLLLFSLRIYALAYNKVRHTLSKLGKASGDFHEVLEMCCSLGPPHVLALHLAQGVVD